MIYFFLISILMLLAGLSAGLVTRRAPKAQVICTAAAAALCTVSLGGLLFERLSGGRAEFMHPWAFLLLSIPFAVLITHTVLRRIFSRQISYPLAHLRVEQTSVRVLFTRWLPILLYTAALILMTAALARPVKVDRTVVPPTEGVDIILLMDVSASMQKQDFYPNRFVAAQETASR